ncbi:MAG: ATP-dependent RNA helicase [bacterium]|nr:ATP-dependent RNA helicase [bacterium]
MQNIDTSLPIYKQQKLIEATIAKNPVTILTAETGAGKSTRVPLWMRQKGKKVHVTQPRRIAARSLSNYLARLTKTTLGKEIGYQTGFDSKQSKETRLLYVTDGVQMIREINGRRTYDILVLDEVHEWNINQEVLVGLVKKNLDKGYYKKTGKRVVIMSATLQADKLSSFLGKAPVISVPGRGFPVTMHHNTLHFLLPDTAQMVELEQNVLVFQPGKKEIEDFSDNLKRMLDAEKLKAKILPLHAELSLPEQAKVFDHYTLPKVVVATDIAQTSLTIDDIDAVVDTGIKKEVRLVKGIEGLYPVDISHAECMQRAGRAGRVREGRYFLCAEAGMQERPAFPEPEIQRLNLDSVVLRLIKMGISPLDFPFFHYPSKALIYKAIKQLKILGAISEDGDVTPDGNKMAEFPVSLRSSRLLLEAQKANPRVLDSAIKCIAILETKGIVNKDAAGEKYITAAFHSDLLNQLALWQSYNRNRKSINQKKFALAKDIYRELNKRLGITAAAGKGQFSKDVPMLYRAILSCFAGEVHIKGGEEYQRDNEVRQLDRDSMLAETKPEMLVGLPFDLVITRENYDTGEKEEMFIPLITFASELTLEFLDALQPFSYSKNETVKFDKNKVTVFREYHFGGKLIRAVTTPPNWENEKERKRIIPMVIEWLEKNAHKYDITQKAARLKTYYDQIKPIVKHKLKSFNFYWRVFLFKEMDAGLRLDDLDLFFKFHSGFSVVHLKKLLPTVVIKELKQARWPGFVEAGGERLEIIYQKNRAFVAFDYPVFEKVKEHELILPTGEKVGIILDKRRFYNWEMAVIHFNGWKKTDVFEKKYKGVKKPGNMYDLEKIPFPQPFEGGKGKDNTLLEFYIVPEIKGNEVFLVHYFDKEEAEAYFKSIRPKWEAFIRNYKKAKIEDIFKQKGWKVR